MKPPSTLSLFALGFAARVIVAPWTQDPWDLQVWQAVGTHVAQGGSPYTHRFGTWHLAYPYPPVWTWICAGMLQPVHWLYPQGGGEWLMRLTLKLPVILADCGIAWVLARMAAPEKRTRILSFYLFNPLPILIAGVWGMFDAIPTFFLLLSLEQGILARPTRSGIWFGIACCFKLVYPLFLLPWMAWHATARTTWRGMARFVLISTGIVLAVCAPYLLQDPGAMYRAMFAYHGERPPQALNAWTWLVWSMQYPASRGLILLANVALAAGMLAIHAALMFRQRAPADTAKRRVHALLGVAAGIAGFFAFSKVVNEPYSVWLLSVLLGLHGVGSRFCLWIYWLQSAVVLCAIGTHIGLAFLQPVLADPVALHDRGSYAATGWLGLLYWGSCLALLGYAILAYRRLGRVPGT